MLVSFFLLGFAVRGLISLQFGVVEIVGISAGITAVLKNVSDLIRENVFVYSGIYKKDDIRIDYERRGLGRPVEKERHNETAYYLRIAKKRGSGRLEECEGFLTFLDQTHVPTVWEGPNYQKTRSISVQDDLRLFNVSQDKKKEIMIFRKPETVDTVNPYAMLSSDINDKILDAKLSVRLGSKSGNVPNKPFEMTFREIIDSAIPN